MTTSNEKAHTRALVAALSAIRHEIRAAATMSRNGAWESHGLSVDTAEWSEMTHDRETADSLDRTAHNHAAAMSDDLDDRVTNVLAS